MQLIALGINHKTAPVAIRERVAFPPEQMQAACAALKDHQTIKEVAIVSTCNRTEIYALLAAQETRSVLTWLSDFHQIPLEDIARYTYLHQDQQAISHLMRVASGLDSLVLGEPQILGQIKEAYETAKQQGLLGRLMEPLFQQVFATAKRVRTETGIGTNPVSVAYAAVHLAQKIFADLHTSRALLIGAGETIELVARHLRQAGVRELVIANRTIEKAKQLADEVQAEAVALSAIPDQLVKADIVISSTAAPLPILGKGMVERALRLRRHQPVFMVDIAVPRDIEPQVGELEDIYLFTVDDLQEVIDENLAARRDAARQAETLIVEGVAEYQRQQRVRDAGRVIGAFRQQAEQLAQQELAQALQQLQQGQDAEAILRRFARQLTNKWLHHPTLKLREASADQRHELLGAAVELLNLSDLIPSEPASPVASSTQQP